MRPLLVTASPTVGRQNANACCPSNSWKHFSLLNQPLTRKEHFLSPISFLLYIL